MIDALLPYILAVACVYGFIDGYLKAKQNTGEENRGKRSKTYWSYRDPKTGIGFGFWD